MINIFNKGAYSCLALMSVAGLVACTHHLAIDEGRPSSLAVVVNSVPTRLGFTEASSFDVVVDHNRVHLMVLGSLPTAAQQKAVYYVSSEDGGQHWSTPSPVPTPKPPAMAVRGNDIQLAAAGDNIVALWQTTGEIPGMGPITGVYSHDGGKTWQVSPNPAANDSGDQSHIDMVGSGQTVHAVWLDDRDENGYQGLRYARSEDAGLHWQPSVTLDDSTCSCCWNKLAIAPTGRVDVLYRDMAVRDMALSQSLDQGTTWQSISHVGDFGWKFEGCPHVGGGLAYSHTDDTVVMHSVVWTGVEHKQGLYYLRSTDNGKGWSVPHKLGNMAMHSDIAAVGAKQVRAVWDETSAEGSRIYSSQSDNAGLSWSSIKAWSLVGHNAIHPRIVATDEGFLVLWTEKQGKQPSQLAAVFLPIH